MKKTRYTVPHCRLRSIDTEPLTAASGTLEVEMDPTETYDGSFSAKTYTPGSVWDEKPMADGFE